MTFILENILGLFLILFWNVFLILNPFTWPEYFGDLFAWPFLPITLGIIIIGLLASSLMMKLYKKEGIAKTLLMGLSLGLILSSSALLLSEIQIPESQIDRSDSKAIVSTGGFPWHNMQYPQPPMGNDQIPEDQWVGLWLNFAFWMLTSLTIAGLNHKHIKKWYKSRWVTFLVLGFFFYNSGILYLLLKFD